MRTSLDSEAGRKSAPDFTCTAQNAAHKSLNVLRALLLSMGALKSHPLRFPKLLKNKSSTIFKAVECIHSLPYSPTAVASWALLRNARNASSCLPNMACCSTEDHQYVAATLELSTKPWEMASSTASINSLAGHDANASFFEMVLTALRVGMSLSSIWENYSARLSKFRL